MAEFETMYPGIAFSPRTTLTFGITAASTEILVESTDGLPEGPNYATLGTDENAETIFYTSKQKDRLSGCVRGVEGAAKVWAAGSVLGRNFTAKDYHAIIANLKMLQQNNGRITMQDVADEVARQLADFEPEGSSLTMEEVSGEIERQITAYDEANDFPSKKEMVTEIENQIAVYHADIAPRTVTIPAGRSVGDVNGDGRVDSEDLGLIYRHVMTEIVLEGEQLTAADVNDDGEVNTADVNFLYRVIMGYAELTPKVLSGPWLVDETAQCYYYDIPVTALKPTTNVTLTPEFAFDSETFIDTECLDGALRIRMKCCPTVENRLRIEFHGETKTRGANDFVSASMVVVQREIPAYGLNEYDKVLQATDEGLKWKAAPSAIPAYTEADYGKMLTPTADGLVWTDPPQGGISGDIPSAEGVEF